MRRILGIVLLVITALLLCAGLGWEAFLGFVWIEDRGADREAILTFIQPLTCCALTPIGLMGLVGLVLTLLPVRSQD